MSRVLAVSGSRQPLTLDEEAYIAQRIEGWLQPGDTLHHGAATGVDSYIHELALAAGCDVKAWPVTPADWRKHGKRAGPMRNRAMLAAGPDLCIAFPRPGSKGTLDFIIAAVGFCRNLIVFWLPDKEVDAEIIV